MSNTANMNAELYVNSEFIKDFSINGELYNSFKSQIYNVNDIIVDTEVTSEDVSVMLFNMLFIDDQENFTDLNTYEEAVNKENYENFFLVNDEIINKNAIRFYLLTNEKMYLFECELPSVFETCNDEFEYMSDPLKDMIWYSELTNPSIVRVEATSVEGSAMVADLINENEVYSTRSTTANSWIGSEVYTTEFVLAGSTVQQRSIPFGYYDIFDVHNAGGNWRGEFYISEGTTYDGATVDYMDNTISYRNVDINMACGKDSQINEAKSQGRIYDISDLSDVQSATFDLLQGTFEWWDKGTSIINVFSALSDVGDDIEFNANGSKLLSTFSIALGINIPSDKYKLYNSSFSSQASNNVNVETPAHYLIFDCKVRSTLADSTVTNTTGCVQFVWDVYVESSYEPIAKEVTQSFTKAYVSSK